MCVGCINGGRLNSCYIHIVFAYICYLSPFLCDSVKEKCVVVSSLKLSGILNENGTINNTESIKRLAEVALAYAKAGGWYQYGWIHVCMG